MNETLSAPLPLSRRVAPHRKPGAAPRAAEARSWVYFCSRSGWGATLVRDSARGAIVAQMERGGVIVVGGAA